MEARLKAALARAADIERELADPDTARDPAKLKTLGREHARLERIRRLAAEYEKLQSERVQAEDLLHDTDPQLVELARADLERLVPETEEISAQLEELLIPRDPMDDRDTIVEIRAGTGGDEAALFAADLLRMYTRYAERRGWTVDAGGQAAPQPPEHRGAQAEFHRTECFSMLWRLRSTGRIPPDRVFLGIFWSKRRRRNHQASCSSQLSSTERACTCERSTRLPVSSSNA